MTNTKSAEAAKPQVEVEVEAGHEHVHGPNCSHHHHDKALAPVVRSSPKIGRNDPCHCGSQLKFKKCCGK